MWVDSWYLGFDQFLKKSESKFIDNKTSVHLWVLSIFLSFQGLVPCLKAKEIPWLEVFAPSRYQHIHNHRGYTVLVVNVQGESLEAFHANTSSKSRLLIRKDLHWHSWTYCSCKNLYKTIAACLVGKQLRVLKRAWFGVIYMRHSHHGFT